MRKVLWISLTAISAIVAAVSADGPTTDQVIGNAISYFGFSMLLGIVYLAPAFLALHRKHHNCNAIVALNVLAGWTALGWIASVVWATTATPSKPDHSSANMGARMASLVVGLFGVLLIGTGFRQFGSIQGLWHSISRNVGATSTLFMPGWMPVIGGIVCLGGALYVLTKCRFFST